MKAALIIFTMLSILSQAFAQQPPTDSASIIREDIRAICFVELFDQSKRPIGNCQSVAVDFVNKWPLPPATQVDQLNAYRLGLALNLGALDTSKDRGFVKAFVGHQPVRVAKNAILRNAYRRFRDLPEIQKKCPILEDSQMLPSMNYGCYEAEISRAKAEIELRSLGN